MSPPSRRRVFKEATLTTRTVRYSLALALVIGLLLPAGLPALAQQIELNETFDDADLPDWEISPGAQVADGLLILEPNGYALRGGDWADAAYLTRIMWDGSGASAFHYQASDAGSFQVYVNDQGVRLLLDQQDQVSEFAYKPYPGLRGTWMELTVMTTGNSHTVLLNGVKVLEAQTPTSLPPGGVLLRSEGGATLRVDNVIIESGEPPTAEEPPAREPTPPRETADVPPSSGALPASDMTWVRLGGPPGGLGYDIRYNFDDPDVWYSTDDGAGVHISRDNGWTWEQSNRGIEAVSGPAGDGIPVFTLAVDPHNPQVIWIGTTSGQIYRSEDGGSTWTEKDDGIIRQPEVLIKFRGVTVDPRSSDVVYVMGELVGQPAQPGQVTTGGIVYKTTDGGEHWTRIWDGGIPSSLTRYLWVDPRDPDVLYVSTGIFDAAAVGDKDFETDPEPFGGLGVLKSTDGGQSWRILGKENGLKFLTIGSLFMHPDDPDVLLAAAGRLVPELAAQHMREQGHTDLGIYRTTDGGESWTQVLEPGADHLVQIFTAVELCPSNPDIAYAASDAAVYRSQDAGVTWTKVTEGERGWGPVGIAAGFPIDLQCAPRDTDRLFANNYQGGNFLSEDGGKTWQNASKGYSGAQVIGVAVDPFDPAHVYATGRSGAWVSLDGGVSWNGITNPEQSGSLTGTECGSVGVDPGTEGHVILSCYSGFFTLDPETKRWRQDPIPDGIHPGTSEIEFAPSDPKTVYVTSASHNTMIHAEVYEDGWGILASRDGGATWEAITGEAFKDAIVTDVAIDPKDADVVYAAAQNGLFKSVDGGATWSSPSSLLADLPVRTAAVSPGDSDHVLAGVQFRGLFLSQDGGETWLQQTSGLEPNGIHRDIVFDPTNPDIVYTADILSGVYQSMDGGGTWRKITSGLANRAVISLSISIDGRHLYAGTSSGGVFRLDLDGQPPAVSPHVPTAPEAGQPAEGEPPAPVETLGEPSPQSPRLPCLSGLAPLAVAAIFVGARRRAR
jgi:photosystem II stability/assembly factor-like uncharacterized protein